MLRILPKLPAFVATVSIPYWTPRVSIPYWTLRVSIPHWTPRNQETLISSLSCSCGWEPEGRTLWLEHLGILPAAEHR